MTTRNGKIARLPFEIREELNHRLLENEPAKTILDWLNAEPAATKVMEALFEGRPISEQNISEWRQGGYEEWLTYHTYLGHVGDLSENAARVALTGINAEHLLLILTAAFADLLHQQDAADEIAFNRRLIVLQHLTKTALSMRRSEQKDARLQLDRERLEILRQRNPAKSPSSSPSSETSKSPRSTPGSHQNDSESRHSSPYHPKAPEIRRPQNRTPANIRRTKPAPQPARPPQPLPFQSNMKQIQNYRIGLIRSDSGPEQRVAVCVASGRPDRRPPNAVGTTAGRTD